MTQPIYGQSGTVVAWLTGGYIYDLGGRSTGMLYHENVYGTKGQHLGIFRNGLFRDHEGQVVGFIEGAHGGPTLPVAKFAPTPPKLSLPTGMSPDRAKAPLPAIPSYCWGGSWQEFITQTGEGAQRSRGAGDNDRQFRAA